MTGNPGISIGFCIKPNVTVYGVLSVFENLQNDSQMLEGKGSQLEEG
jgi:hypothetical protein